MHRKWERHGGLVGINYKKIEDSYAVSSCYGGGVCGINRGRIVRCYGDYRGMDVCAVSEGETENALITKTMAEIEGWDFESIWRLNAKGYPVFREENWLLENLSEEYETVSTAEELIELAERIQNGDSEASHRNIRLTCDIHFHNRSILPIGTIQNPYKGKFDGAGFSVSGFRIRQGQSGCAGFFGCMITATVTNLTVNGKVTGGCHTGILCGQSNLSKILYCGAVGECSGYGNVGGLCGNNNGLIQCCNFYGYVRQAGPKWGTGILLAVVLLEILLLAVLAGRARAQETKIVFVPEMVDANIQQVVSEPAESISQSDHHITMQVQKRATYHIGSKTVDMQMINPSGSNQIAVIEMLLPEDYCELGDEKYGYDQQEPYVIVARTGGIPPGYYVEQLEWLGFSDGTEPEPGIYQAFVRISFYDAESNEKAMIDSAFGIELSILKDMEIEPE